MPFVPPKQVTGVDSIVANMGVGSGKTCVAVAAASHNFDTTLEKPYTIIWITRGKLKEEMWKNTLKLVCNKSMQDRVRQGLPLRKQNLKWSASA